MVETAIPEDADYYGSQGRPGRRRRFDVGHLFHRRAGGPAPLPRLRRQRPRRAFLVRGGGLPVVARRAAEPQGARRPRQGALGHGDPEAAPRADRPAARAAEEDDADGGAADRRVGPFGLRSGRRGQLAGGDGAQGGAAHGPDADAGGGVGADPAGGSPWGAPTQTIPCGGTFWGGSRGGGGRARGGEPPPRA